MSANETFNDIYVESMKGKIGMTVHTIKDEITLSKKWAKGMISRFKRYSNNNMSDEDFDMIYNEFSAALAAENFNEYYVHYKNIAKYCHFNPHGTTINGYKLKRGKEKNKNRILVLYSISRTRIVIPNGMGIYHQTDNDRITELKPKFKTRKNGLLCSYPRIYFSLRKNVPNFIVDHNIKSRLTTYTPTKKFTTGFIDPAAPWTNQNNIYIETNVPIPVKKVDTIKRKNKKTESKNLNESTSIDINYLDNTTFGTIEEFMEHNNLTYMNPDEDLIIDNTIMEGFKKTIKNAMNTITRNKWYKKDSDIIKNKWENKTQHITHKKVLVKYVDEKVYKKSKEMHEILCDSELYSKYKNAFDYFASMFGFSKDKSVIEYIKMTKNRDNNDKNHPYRIELRFSEGAEQVTIPIGYNLIHMSPVKDIRELKPTFRSRSRGYYFYSTPRIYVTMGKVKLDPSKFGATSENKLYSYSPKHDYKFAYIDPTLTDYGTGAIYIPSKFPIPVVPTDEKYVKEYVDESNFFVNDY